MSVVLVKSTPERKLVAVIGVRGKGLYIRNPSGKGVVYIYENGDTTNDQESLESLAAGFDRTPVYVGEEITIKFE